MSADEETELRDLVAQTLESNGVLGKIRAQLRVCVFQVLEEQDSLQNKSKFTNAMLKKFLGTKEGRLITGLVREFLEFFSLDYTLAVFDPEVGITKDQYGSRGELARELDIVDGTEANVPLLSEIFHRTTLDGSKNHRSSVEDMMPKHIAAAREKFDQYDQDHNGNIDKDELRCLFCDMFPHFNLNMLERYVHDEFRAADLDFSNGIDFEEFLAMYKRLFVLCKSTISGDITAITVSSPRRMQDTDIKSISHVSKKKGNASRPLGGSNTSSKSSLPKENGYPEPEITKSQSKKQDSPRSIHSDLDDDSFFDDPLPNSDHSKSHVSDRSRKDMKPSEKQPPSKSSGLSSLAGLPSLGPVDSHKSTAFSDFDDIDKKIADLGVEMPHDDDYDDDFESSNISALGPTPRSARSDHNVKSIDEDIEEDIEMSGADDLLKSDNSAGDELTTDRSISPTDQSAAIDYMEDVMQP